MIYVFFADLMKALALINKIWWFKVLSANLVQKNSIDNIILLAFQSINKFYFSSQKSPKIIALERVFDDMKYNLATMVIKWYV